MALVACWQWEGSLVDASGDDLVVTTVNTTFAAGRTGMGLAMDATSDATVAETSVLSPTNITIELWLRPAQLPATGRMGLLDNDGRYGLFLTSTGLQCVAGANVASTVLPAVDAWTHVACTYDGTTGRLFVDGIEVLTALGAGLLATGPATVKIGGNSPSGDRFVGTLDQLRVFSVARTPTQICDAALRTSCP